MVNSLIFLLLLILFTVWINSFLLIYFHFQYIRKLLFSDLDKSTLEHVLRQLRKLPWGECEPYLLKCFLKVHKGKYGQIHLIASLTAGLSRYHDEFAVSVVDEVISSSNLFFVAFLLSIVKYTSIIVKYIS